MTSGEPAGATQLINMRPDSKGTRNVLLIKIQLKVRLGNGLCCGYALEMGRDCGRRGAGQRRIQGKSSPKAGGGGGEKRTKQKKEEVPLSRDKHHRKKKTPIFVKTKTNKNNIKRKRTKHKPLNAN